MATRETKTILTAEDRTAGAFASMQKNLQTTMGQFDRWQGMLAGLAGGGAIGAFGLLVKNALDTGEALNKMSQKTGIAVEQLSELSYAAKLADVSNETLGKGIKALSESLVAANDPTSKQAKLFKELGVNIKGDTLSALEQLAKQYQALPDGATKAALSTELFKKAGQDMIPFLNQGADGIAKLRGEARALGLTMSSETAKAAEQFNDNLKALQASSGKLGVSLLNEMGPGLVKASEAMKEALVESGKLKAAWVGLGAVGAFLFTDDMLAPATKLNKDIREMSETIKVLQAARAEKGGILDWMFNSDAKLDARLAAANAELTKMLAQLETASGKTPGGETPEQKAAREAAAKAKADAITKLLADQKSAADEIAKYNERMRQLDIKGWIAYADNVFAEADELNNAMAKIHDDYWKNEEKYREIDVKGWVAYIDAMEREYEDGLTAIGAKQPSFHQSMEKEWSGYLGRIESGFSDIWTKLIDRSLSSWKQFTTSLRDLFKRTVSDFIYQSFAKPIMLQLVATAAGGLGFSGLASAATGAAGGGGSSLLGSIGSSALQSTFGTAASSYLFGGAAAAGSVLGAGGATIGSGTMMMLGGSTGAGAVIGSAGATTSGLLSAGGLTSTITTALAAIPVWGWIAIAAMGAYAAFGGKGGGPKIEGGSWQTFNADGTQTRSAFYGGDGRHSTATAFDTAQQSVVSATATSYFELLRRLGGTSNGVTFGLDADRDPQGTANQRIWGNVNDAAGNAVFRSAREFGRDTDLAPELQLEAQRMLIAAFQVSELPTAIKNLFSGVDALTITAEAAGALIKTAAEYGDVIAALRQSIEGLTIDGLLGMQAAGESLTQTFTRVAGAFDAYSKLFIPEQERNEKLFTALSDAIKAQNGILPATRDAYRALVEAQDLSSESGRALWQVLIGSAAVADQYYRTLEAGTETIEEQLKLINKEQDLRIQLMELEGNVAGALEARRAIELATLDAGSRVLQLRINALQDEATAAQAAAAASERMRSAMAGFNSVAGSMYPTYGRQVAQVQLDSALSRFATTAYSSYTTGNATAQADIVTRVMANLRNGTLNPANALAYAATQGPQAVEALTAVLQAYQTLQSASENAAGAIDQFAGAANSAAEQLQKAVQSLSGYLRGSLLGGLSPLTPQARLDEAQSQYVENLMRAQRGDAASIGGFGAARDAYLREARDFFASGQQYSDIFANTYNQGAAITGGEVRPITAADMTTNTASIVAALSAVQQQVATVTAAVQQLTSVTQQGDQANVQATNNSGNKMVAANDAAVRY